MARKLLLTPEERRKRHLLRIRRYTRKRKERALEEKKSERDRLRAAKEKAPKFE